MKLINKILTSKFFLRLFLILIAIIICQKISGVAYISDTMALGAMGFVAGLIALYNNDKHKENRNSS